MSAKGLACTRQASFFALVHIVYTPYADVYLEKLDYNAAMTFTHDGSFRIGLISDTHMPERCLALPDTLLNVFADVDLILHAGDVGELWVLERLSEIAPVVAVHGNDDSAESQSQLPYQQLLIHKGQRILLWHSHFPDRPEEMAFRKKDDTWERILYRTHDRAKQAGATIAVFGHIHVPLVWHHDGILVINPGALGSGNFQMRMLMQTAAVLELGDGQPTVTHFDLADGSVHIPNNEWANGFIKSAFTYQASLLEAPLPLPRGEHIYGNPAVRQMLRRVAIPCWKGEKQFITAADYIEAVNADDALDESIKQLYRTALAELV